MVVVDTHLHLIAIVVTVAVVVHVEFQGAQNFVVSITLIPLFFFLFNHVFVVLYLLFSINILCHCAVLVTGLPSSASWQDLKVTMIFLLGKSYSVGCSHSWHHRS